MNNLILFVNSFLSYILLMVVIAIVAALGFFVGLKWRKAKDARAALAEGETTQETQNITE